MSDNLKMIGLPPGIELKWVPQNDDEPFDRVEFRSIERWKESELSGDEWRFTFIGFFYSHGVLMMKRYGASIEDIIVSAGHWFRHPRSTDDAPEVTDEWLKARAEVEDRCAQPCCENPWTVLYHPKKKFTRQGRPDGDHWDGRKEGTGLNWLAVRGFCDRHRHRGDCDLEDADDNYELIAEKVKDA